MRVLHVVASYLPARRYGGTIVSVHGLCRALATRGHDVHVYTTSVDGAGDSPVPLECPVSVDGVWITYFRSTRLRRIYYAPQLGAALRRGVAGFDVVHIHAIYLWPLWRAAREAERASVPYIVSPRGMLEKALLEQRSPWLKAVAIACFDRRMLVRSAAIHVTSAREADEVRAFGFALPQISEIPNGVETPVDAIATSPAVRSAIEGPPFVLFLGRLSWKKGLDRLISAIALSPSARLVVAGYDEEGYRATLEARAANAGVSDRVRFLDAVHDGDKNALLSAARVLALTSYSENFGNVALEAMVHGTPVLLTPEVGIADVIQRDGGGIVTDGAPPALAAALTRLLGDQEHAATLGARARQVAARFSWDAVAARMETLYEEVAHQRASGERGPHPS